MIDRDIAIIGVGCRFPDADDAAAFFENLVAGHCSVKRFSDAELAASGVDPYISRQPNYKPYGAPLFGDSGFDESGFDEFGFDHQYFRLTPKEARLLDPQHRLLLELAVHALDDAGTGPESDTSIGLFGSVSASSYFLNYLLPAAQSGSADFSLDDALRGTRPAFAISRIAYHLGLTGPTMLVDTACSSSLVAVHEAVKAIRHGECNMALAGGVSVQFPVKSGYLYHQDGILSEDGLCRAFDASATGSVRGNGGGIVLLKPLKQAMDDGDKIYAVITGSAVNNDGNQRAGFTAPGVNGQSRSLQQAIKDAGINPVDLTCYEAHGSGTRLGDEIELKAIHRALESDGSTAADSRHPLKIGSVKTNIGHLDNAAGIAGLIKTLLMLKHRVLVPSLHFSHPNATLANLSDKLRIQTETLQLADDMALNAAVASLGIGGTNAHIILRSHEEPTGSESASLPEVLWLPVTASYDAALTEQVSALIESFRTHHGQQVTGIMKTLWDRRRHYAARIVFSGKDPEELIARLQDFLENTPSLTAGDQRHFGSQPLPQAIYDWLQGGSVRFSQVYPNQPQTDWVRLPGYRFVRQFHGIEPPSAPDAEKADHPFKNITQSPENSSSHSHAAIIESLTKLWEQSFGFSPIGIQQNFFELGGHSLLATQIIAALNDQFGVSLGLKEFFGHPTIESLADLVANTAAGHQPAGSKNNYQQVPLTPMQLELWYLHMRQPDNNTYNLVAAERIRGPIDLTDLYDAVTRVVQRYAILRSRYQLADNRVVQSATDTLYQAIHYRDHRISWAGLSNTDKHEAVARCIDEFGNQPFDLAAGRLFEACIVRVSMDEHILILRQHRIVSDAQTLGTLFQEIVSNYLANRHNETLPRLQTDHGYYDYCFKLERELSERQPGSPQARRLQEDRIFWQETLRNPPVTKLPTVNPHYCHLTESGRSIRFTLKEQITQKLQLCCSANGISLFSFLLATFKLTLFSFTRQRDIIVVTPALNRDQLEFSQTPGHFMNRVAIRSQLREHNSLIDNIRDVHHNNLLALQHQSLPFEAMLETTGLLSRYRNEPLFQTVFMLQDTEQDESLTLPDISLSPVPVPFNRSRYDLTGVMRLENGVLYGRLDCKADLLDDSTLDQIKARWIKLIDAVIDEENTVLDKMVKPEPGITPTDTQEDFSKDHKNRSTEQLKPALNYWQLALGRYLPPDELTETRMPDFWQAGGTTAQLISLYHLIYNDFPDVCFRKLALNPDLTAHADYLESLKNQRIFSGNQQEPSAKQQEPSAIHQEPSAIDIEPSAEGQNPVPLSPFQRRLWFLQKYHPDSGAYNLPAAFIIEGTIDPSRLRSAILSAQQEFYLLNCRISEQDDQPRWVRTDTPVAFQVTDLGNLSPESRDTSIDFLSEKILWAPFDLNSHTDPLWRSAWIRLAPDESILLFSFHHLIADQVSGGLFLQALLDHYQGADSFHPSAKNSQTGTDFPAFVAAQNQWLTTSDAGSQRAFWRTYLKDCHDFHFWNSSGGKELTTQEYVISLTASQTQSLQAIGSELSVSLSTVLQSLYGIFLYRLSGNRCFCMGMPASLHEGNWQTCFGPLLNTLPVKFEATPFRTFRQQIQACHEYMMEAISHKALPLEDIIEVTRPPRNTDLPPLFQILFAFREEQPLSVDTRDFTLTTVPTNGNASEYPVALEALKHVDGTELRLCLSDTHFSQGTQQQIADNLYQLIEECLLDTEHKVIQFLQPDLPAPKPNHAASLTSQLLQCINTHAEKTAITGTQISIGYQALGEEIAGIQYRLLARDLKEGQGIALYLKDRALLPQVLMACLATGLYFVPIDTRWNTRRICEVLVDSDVSALITDARESIGDIELPDRIDLICTDYLTNGDREANHSLEARGNDHHLAYIMYTSGSTGAPKGVAIRQSALKSYCQNLPEQVKPGTEHTVLALTASSFDIMLTELVLPLLTGGTIALFNAPMLPEAVARFIKQYEVNYIQTTPSLWSLLLESSSLLFSPGTIALAGGEALPTKLAKQLLDQGVRLFNVYGPTEATVWCTCKQVTAKTIMASGQWINAIGEPFGNIRAVILDQSGMPLAEGAIGELALEGENLSAGYWKNDTQNAQRFISVSDADNPEVFTDKYKPNRFYRTGDLAQWLDGELYFYGRTDSQVKLHGQRLELNEINSAIRSITGVKDVVTLLIDRQNQQLLGSYVAGSDISSEELRNALLETLPFHIIPSVISVNHRAILSSNGKWDIQKVRAHLQGFMDTRVSAKTDTTEKDTHDAITRSVRILMEKALHQPGMGFRDNFFDLGGHSLLVVRLTNHIAQEFDIQLPLSAVFEHPTPEKLGMLINACLSQAPVRKTEDLYEEGEI